MSTSNVLTGRLTTDNTHSASRDELQRHRSELNDLERTLRERQTSVKNCEQAIVRHKRVSRELRIEVQRLEADVEDMQDKLDSGAVEEGKLEALKEGLDEAKEELTTHQASYGDSVVARDKAVAVMKTVRERMAAIDEEAADIKAKIRKAELKKVKMSENRDAALRAKNVAFANIEQLDEAYKSVERDRNDQAHTVGCFIEEATLVCNRVPIDRGETATSIETKLNKLHEDLKAWERR